MASNPDEPTLSTSSMFPFTAVSRPSIANPLNLSHPYNPLTHWGNISSLRNPYSSFNRSNITNTEEDENNINNYHNPRTKHYQESMDKQRLEHILFSGDQSNSLNQQKERMRQKLLQKNKQRYKKQGIEEQGNNSKNNSKRNDTNSPQINSNNNNNNTNFTQQKKNKKNKNKNSGNKKKHSKQKNKNKKNNNNNNNKHNIQIGKKNRKNKSKSPLQQPQKTNNTMVTAIDNNNSLELDSNSHSHSSPSNTCTVNINGDVEANNICNHVMQQDELKLISNGYDQHENMQNDETSVPCQQNDISLNDINTVSKVSKAVNEIIELNGIKEKETETKNVDGLLEVIETQNKEINALKQNVMILSESVNKLSFKMDEFESNKCICETNEISELQKEILVLKKRVNDVEYQQSLNENNKCKNQHHEAVREWLKNEVNLEQYYHIFIDNGFEDMLSVRTLNMEILNNIKGIDKIGHKSKILYFVQKLNQHVDCTHEF